MRMVCSNQAISMQTRGRQAAGVQRRARWRRGATGRSRGRSGGGGGHARRGGRGRRRGGRRGRGRASRGEAAEEERDGRAEREIWEGERRGEASQRCGCERERVRRCGGNKSRFGGPRRPIQSPPLPPFTPRSQSARISPALPARPKHSATYAGGPRAGPAVGPSAEALGVSDSRQRPTSSVLARLFSVIPPWPDPSSDLRFSHAQIHLFSYSSLPGSNLAPSARLPPSPDSSSCHVPAHVFSPAVLLPVHLH